MSRLSEELYRDTPSMGGGATPMAIGATGLLRPDVIPIAEGTPADAINNHDRISARQDLVPIAGKVYHTSDKYRQNCAGRDNCCNM